MKSIFLMSVLVAALSCTNVVQAANDENSTADSSKVQNAVENSKVQGTTDSSNAQRITNDLNSESINVGIDDLENIEKVTVGISQVNQENVVSKNGNGQDSVNCKKKWRLAFVQNGSFSEFKILTRYLLLKLYDDGYIDLPEDLPFEFDFDDPEIWKVMSEYTMASKKSCVVLLPDGLYNANWNESIWEQTSENLRNRLQETKDIDLLVGLGVATGIKFADSSFGIPIVIADAASPEAAGVIGPGKFSTKPLVHVQKYPKRVSMALKNYYNIFKFKKMGLITDVNEKYRAMQSFDVIKSVVNELGVEFVYCIGDLNSREPGFGQVEFARCRDELINAGVDTLYLPPFNGTTEKGFFKLIHPLVDRDIIVISESRIYEVEKGALISLVETSIEDSGRFEATVIERILDGEKPEEINQYYHTNLAFALNLKTARMVDWKPSFELLMSVEYLFDTIDFR